MVRHSFVGLHKHEVLQQASECSSRFILAAPRFFTVSTERFPRMFFPSFCLLRAWTFASSGPSSMRDFTFANANLIFIILVYSLLFRYLLVMYLSLGKSLKPFILYYLFGTYNLCTGYLGLAYNPFSWFISYCAVWDPLVAKHSKRATGGDQYSLIVRG